MHEDSPGPPPFVARPASRAWRTSPASADARAFHASLPDYLPTPLVELPSLAAELGVGRLFLKDESRRLGLPAFKALGASWAVQRAVEEHRRAGRSLPVTLLSATDGNHGRAVARAARNLGQGARIHVAPGVHPAAVAAIRQEGAEVVLGALSYDDAVRRAVEDARLPSTILVQDMGWAGYEDVPAWIVEGYGTMCLEIDEQLAAAGAPDPDLVAVPVGVGSLAQAVVRHYRSRPAASPPAILAVEPVAAACVLESLRRGEVVTVETGTTIMAGLNCGTPSGAAWPVLRAGLDAAVAIDDHADTLAIRDLAALGVRAGPCGAAALAGVRHVLLGAGAPDRRRALGIGRTSTVVLLSTEGPEANPQG